MNKRHTIVIALSALLLFSTTSCKKDMFDAEVYQEILKQEFPIDPVDSLHHWNLTARRTATITVPASAKDATRLMVLTDNPAGNNSAAIMAEISNFNVGNNVLVFAAPEVQTTFYAALEQADGSLLFKSFTSSNSRVSMADATSIPKPANTLGYQTFTYCYEENYPEPGDYDFNDCVLRISVQPGDKTNQRKINVSMVATGADKLIGAAIHINNYNYSDIESVTIQDGTVWDEGYPARRYLMENTETLQQGRNGEAVIRLFENASWIIVHNQTDNIGALINYKINVTDSISETELQMTPTVKTYIVTFKENATALLNNFSLLDIDPFIVTNYNGATWETHTYNQKFANVLFDGGTQDSGHMTWALCIPTSDFRWPLEGTLIGTAKDGMISGAYRKANHAFGSWAANRNNSKDWYLYPTITSVYKGDF